MKSNQHGLAARSKNQRGPDTFKGDFSQTELDENRHDQDVENALHFFRDNEYYTSREYNLEDIEARLLSVGNISNIVVHWRGNVEGYMGAGSRYKFLCTVTGRHDLPVYLDEEVEVQKSFLSAFLKDDDYAGWITGKQPKVSLVLRKSGVKFDTPKAAAGQVFTRRAEND